MAPRGALTVVAGSALEVRWSSQVIYSKNPKDPSVNLFSKNARSNLADQIDCHCDNGSILYASNIVFLTLLDNGFLTISLLS